MGERLVDQTLIPGTVLARDDRRLRNRPMAHQRRLDLARLDAEPAYLHLRIGSPHELQHPVGPPTREVPGAVHPAPRSTKRVRNEPFRRQTRTAHIPTRKTRPRNVKLPAHTSRYRLKTTVQNIDPRVRYGLADRNGIIKVVLAGHREAGAKRCPFGRTVTVDQPAIVLRRNEPAHVRNGQNIAARQQLPYACNRRKILIDHPMKQCRCQPQHADASVRDRALEVCYIERAIRRDHQFGSIKQRAPNLECRGIK